MTGTFPALEPALYLPAQKALRMTDLIKPAGSGIDPVKPSQGVDDDFGKSAIDDRIRATTEPLRHFTSDNHAVSPLHDEKGGADEGRVLAENECAGRGREGAIETREDGEFTAHVVRPGCHWTEWRPAQDQVDLGVSEEVGEIGVPARELTNRGNAFGPGNLSLEEVGHALNVKCLFRSDIDQVAGG